MALAALVVSACAIPDDELVTTEATQAIGGAWGGGGDDCEDWGCGQNSPEIDQLGAHEWRKDFGWNSRGFRIKHITHENYPSYARFNINVNNAAIGATSVDGFYNVTGSSVNGLVLHIEHINGFHYQIRVGSRIREQFFADYDYTDSWTPTTSAYILEWRYDYLGLENEDKIWKNICSKPQAVADNLGMNEAYAVVFEGDRINADTKTVFGYDESYFNIGCASHALAKLHLTGYTEAAKKLTGGQFTSYTWQRQAMLKMFSADYCGTGMAFTRAGEALYWKDSRDYNRYGTSMVGLEARWASTGAKCLETPRLSTTTYPTLRDDIAAECAAVNKTMPTCMALHGNKDVNNLEGWTVNSANPACNSWGCPISW